MFRIMLPLALLVLALPATAQESKPIVFEVLLPATATLEIDGYKTTSTGESRSFETPAVVVGKSYSYVLKATDGKKKVTKTIILKTTGNDRLVFDLRKDFALAMPGDGDKQPVKDPKVEKQKGPKVPGFVSYVVDGRVWVFREGSKELAAYNKDGDLEKHVSRIKGGPKGMTIKAPDYETIDAYMKGLPK
jgi:uncharacterized protein (TIGR03000 family)